MGNYEITVLKVKEIVSKITRIPADEIVETDNLIEIGADSVVLMEINSLIKESFLVDIPLSLYFQELTSIEQIASYVNAYGTLATEETNTEQTVLPDSEPIEYMPRNKNAVSNEPGIYQLISEQIKLLQNQLALLNGTAISDNREAVKELGKSTANPINQKESNSYVPYKKLNLTKRKNSQEQQLCIDKLIKLYTAKTQSSKKYADTYRKQYADCRRFHIKEIIYQLIFKNSNGAYITDIDDNQYIDLAMDFGASLFGHNKDFINQAIRNELQNGFPLSLVSGLTGEVAEMLTELTGLERAAFYNSGTEAVMVAIRLARAATRKKKIVIFAGSYHGTFDGVLGLPGNKDKAKPMAIGINESMVDDLIILDYGNEESLIYIEEHADEIAAVLIEPVQSRKPELQPVNFLMKLRAATEERNIAFIFDEMILGFRLGKGGAQEYYEIKADMATYGKIAGGGLPIGIVAGSTKFMNGIDGGIWSYGDDSVPPDEDKRTFTAGTFCHHPLTMAAAKAVLTKIKSDGNTIYQGINEKTKYLAETLNTYFEKNEIPIEITYCGSLFRFVLKGDLELFYYYLILKGVYIWEGRNCFISTEHTYEDLDFVIKAVKETCIDIEPFYRNSSSHSKLPVPLTGKQQKILALEAAHKKGNMLQEMIAVQINGYMDFKLLRECCKELAERHEILNYVLDQDMSNFIVSKKRYEIAEFLECQSNAVEDKIEEIRVSRFDYQNGPLIKFILIHCQDQNNEYRFIMNSRHLIIDGWSLSVLYQELIELYHSKVNKKNISLPKPMQFRSYVECLNNKLNSMDRKMTDKILLSLKDCQKNRLFLPQSIDADIYDKKDGCRISLKKDEVFMKKIRKLSSDLKCTPFYILLSVFQIMLKEITGGNEILVGIPYAGQQEFLDTPLIGNCVSILPLSVDLDLIYDIKDLVQFNKNKFSDLLLVGDIESCEINDFNEAEQQITILFNIDRITKQKGFENTVCSILPVTINETAYHLFFATVDKGIHYKKQNKWTANL